MTEGSIKKSSANSLEYIRIRLYLMASLPNFEELVKKKVHLYFQGGFIEEISKTIGGTRKKVSNYCKIARVKLRAMEDEENADIYNELAESYSSEFQIDINILPQNSALFHEIVKEYNL